MRVKVRYFGPLRDVAGAEREEVELAAGSDTGLLLQTLISRHPKLDDYAGELKMAVNREIARRPTPLAEGDEVALLPPVSGG